MFLFKLNMSLTIYKLAYPIENLYKLYSITHSKSVANMENIFTILQPEKNFEHWWNFTKFRVVRLFRQKEKLLKLTVAAQAGFEEKYIFKQKESQTKF